MTMSAAVVRAKVGCAIALVLVFGCFALPAAIGNPGEQQIYDSGSAGNPIDGPDYVIRHEQTSQTGVSLADSLSTLSPAQQEHFHEAVAGSIGLDLQDMGLSGGSGQTWLESQWHEGQSQPHPPNTNHSTTTFTTEDGLTITIAFGSTGDAEGRLADSHTVGCVGVYVTDADGNTAWVGFHTYLGEFCFQHFHLEQLVRDNGVVNITGPDQVDEDTTNTWSADLDDSSLPPDTSTAWGAQWSGPPRCEWTAAGGDPDSGSDSSFSTRFVQPGTFTVSVQVERNYTYWVERPVETGAEPPELPWVMEEFQMEGTIRGTGSKSGPIDDITPPDLTFTLRAEGGGTGTVAVSEDPPDVAPPGKTCSVAVDGPPFSTTTEDPFSASGSVPAGEPIRIDQSLAAGLFGFHVFEGQRFVMSAEATDNYSPVSALDPVWTIVNEDSGDEILPAGQVDRFIMRAANYPDGPPLLLRVFVDDEAGNGTTLEIPVWVLPRGINVQTISHRMQRR